ncbi:olfactory receptor 11A1-like [Xenopus tropicalis]|uniref:Olfactory receptor n=1 Tax=Xenopus tropicalis TaxID=8364 RepID=A0A8J1IZ92_XENTR|nr:olfactory receptor 11A1-like [Xenopus tropicalis]
MTRVGLGPDPIPVSAPPATSDPPLTRFTHAHSALKCRRTRQPVLQEAVQDQNQTSVLVFHFLGFGDLPGLQMPLFCGFLLVYVAIIAGNLLIVFLVSFQQSLHSPMYLFLSHLSLCDVWCTTNIIPNMLNIVLFGGGTISATGCIAQFYLFGSLTTTESFLLTVMSYDRYLAICYPLHYFSIMDLRLLLCLTTWSWVLGFVLTLIPSVLVGSLQFCGPSAINHFFCDLSPLLALSCSPRTSEIQTEIIFSSIPVILFPFIFIIGTYLKIFLTILNISSKRGRQKTFSTCSSHLIIVCTYYGTLIIVYMIPAKQNFSNVNKILSLLYIVVTPLFNPIIYSLRNREIKTALWKIMSFTAKGEV